MQAIVCVSKEWGIGLDNELLFHISADLRRFRALTTGRTILLGHRTLLSLPGGKPLPDRRSIVLTHRAQEISGVETAASVEEALALAGDDAVVIGGASVYNAFLPYCDRVFVTLVDAAPEADAFFPNLSANPNWRIAEESAPMEENGLTFRYIDYVRR